jgi:hypothetical protein
MLHSLQCIDCSTASTYRSNPYLEMPTEKAVVSNRTLDVRMQNLGPQSTTGKLFLTQRNGDRCSVAGCGHHWYIDVPVIIGAGD